MSRGFISSCALAGLLAAAAALCGCMREVDSSRYVPAEERSPAAITAAATVDIACRFRLGPLGKSATLDCEMAASDSGLRLRAGVAGSGTLADAVITADGFSAYVPAGAKLYEGRFDAMKPRVRDFLEFARSGYVELFMPSLRPREGETVKALTSGGGAVLEYSGASGGVCRRRLRLAEGGRVERLERFSSSGRLLLTVEYPEYGPGGAGPAGRPIPSRLNIAVRGLLRASLSLRELRFPPELPERVLKLSPPSGVEKVTVGAAKSPTRQSRYGDGARGGESALGGEP
jgi:hypothetical protein